MARIKVNESILRWAIDRSGLSSEALQKKFPKLLEWETGKSLPTLRKLEEFAKATLTPLGYLFLETPPVEKLPIPHFRTVADQPLSRSSAELLDTVQVMEQRQAWLREFLVKLGEEPLPFVGSAKLDGSPPDIAQNIRSVLGLGERWASTYSSWTKALRHLQNAMEKVGVLVAVNSVVRNNTHRKLDPEEFRGFVLVDEYAPLVFVNGNDYKAAQMFTLAHELAHIWFGASAAFDLKNMQPAQDATELASNKLAAEFLIPESELLKAWSSFIQSENPFQSAARQFKVSELVAARRALDLNLIDRQRFFNFYRDYQDRERESIGNRTGHGDFYANQNARIGRRFAQAVVQAVRKGDLLYADAYELTGLYGKTFEHYMNKLSLGQQ